MLFDPDHMSVKARKPSLDLIEEMDYTGVLSSHSWSTPDAYPRIYQARGFITPYAGDSTGFVEKWKQPPRPGPTRATTGASASAPTSTASAPRATRAAPTCRNPVTYPFTGLGGVKVDKQVTGERVYDINEDGVAHYGLYPDWIQDLRKIAGPSAGDGRSSRTWPAAPRPTCRCGSAPYGVARRRVPQPRACASRSAAVESTGRGPA